MLFAVPAPAAARVQSTVVVALAVPDPVLPAAQKHADVAVLLLKLELELINCCCRAAPALRDSAAVAVVLAVPSASASAAVAHGHAVAPCVRFAAAHVVFAREAFARCWCCSNALCAHDPLFPPGRLRLDLLREELQVVDVPPAVLLPTTRPSELAPFVPNTTPGCALPQARETLGFVDNLIVHRGVAWCKYGCERRSQQYGHCQAPSFSPTLIRERTRRGTIVGTQNTRSCRNRRNLRDRDNGACHHLQSAGTTDSRCNTERFASCQRTQFVHQTFMPG